MDFSKLPLSYEGKVEPKHLDFLGHMNVMWYTQLFDRATWGFYEGFGFGQDYHQGDKGSFALEMYTRYLAEVRLGEGFKVYTRAIARSKKLFHFIHFMVRERDGELSATSEMLGIHIDMRTRLSNEIPAELAAMWDRIIAEHNQLDWDAPISGVMAP
jgi:acyl-CoA thioester hydrolase